MIFVALSLCVFLATTPAEADFGQAGGSQRRQRTQETYNIDDVIRAEEDPHFDQYLKDREREKREEKAAALEYEKQLRIEKAARHKAFLQYLKEKRADAAREKLTKQKNTVDENVVWRQQQEKNRQEYERKQAIVEQRQEAERKARFRKAMALMRSMPPESPPSTERMPASGK